MRRFFIILASLLLVALVAVGGYFGISALRNSGLTIPASAEASEIPFIPQVSATPAPNDSTAVQPTIPVVEQTTEFAAMPTVPPVEVIPAKLANWNVSSIFVVTHDTQKTKTLQHTAMANGMTAKLEGFGFTKAVEMLRSQLVLNRYPNLLWICDELCSCSKLNIPTEKVLDTLTASNEDNIVRYVSRFMRQAYGDVKSFDNTNAAQQLGYLGGLLPQYLNGKAGGDYRCEIRVHHEHTYNRPYAAVTVDEVNFVVKVDVFFPCKGANTELPPQKPTTSPSTEPTPEPTPFHTDPVTPEPTPVHEDPTVSPEPTPGHTDDDWFWQPLNPTATPGSGDDDWFYQPINPTQAPSGGDDDWFFQPVNPTQAPSGGDDDWFTGDTGSGSTGSGDDWFTGDTGSGSTGSGERPSHGTDGGTTGSGDDWFYGGDTGSGSTGSGERPSHGSGSSGSGTGSGSSSSGDDWFYNDSSSAGSGSSHSGSSHSGSSSSGSGSSHSSSSGSSSSSSSSSSGSSSGGDAWFYE